MTTPLRFSLITSTIGRPQELARFFVSLSEQTYRNFELILVDQSEGDELVELVQRFGDKFPIIHLRSGRGLSRGRNLGLTAASGDLIGFPDDDGWYGKETLERVAAAFTTQSTLDVLSCMARDETGAPLGRWDTRPGVITRRNVWRRAISMTIFLRRHVIERVGVFDERLGVGSNTPFSSGEETDLLIRILDLDFSATYDPTLAVYHPNKKYLSVGIDRSFGYGAGMGFVLAKHRSSLPMICSAIARPMMGAMIFLVAGRASRAGYQIRTMRGRWWGYMEGRKLGRRGLPLGGSHELRGPNYSS